MRRDCAPIEAGWPPPATVLSLPSPAIRSGSNGRLRLDQQGRAPTSVTATRRQRLSCMLSVHCFRSMLASRLAGRTGQDPNLAGRGPVARASKGGEGVGAARAPRVPPRHTHPVAESVPIVPSTLRRRRRAHASASSGRHSPPAVSPSSSATSPRSSGSGSRTTTSTSASRHLRATSCRGSAGSTGLLGAYLALVQVLLLARLPLLERLAGFDRLTVWHRWNGFACCSSSLAHTLMAVYGYALDGQARSSRSSGRWSATAPFPGMVTATIGTVLFVVVRSRSLVIVARQPLLRALVRGPPHRLRGDRARLVPRDPDGGDLALNPARRLLARPLLRHAGAHRASGWRSPLVHGLPLPAAGRRGDRREGPEVVSLRMAGRRLDRLRRPPGPVLPLALPHRAATGGRRTRSRSRRPPTAARCGSASRPPATTPRGSARSRSGRASSPRGRSARFTDGARRRGKALLIAGGIGITPVRALPRSIDGRRRRHPPRRSQPATSSSPSELARARRPRAAPALHYVVGDHAAAEGRDLLSPAHLRELVPDLAERDVYLCGPPGMVAAMPPNLRRAGVARRRLHVERFAL